MKKYFFYTVPTILDPQNRDQAFGPVDDSIGSSADKYQITNLHTVQLGKVAPAIAVCDGMICIQEDELGTYSIILKPKYQPNFDFPYIKYFIYKGIKSSSLTNGSSIDFTKENEVPFINDIFKSWKPEIINNTDTVNNSKDVLGLIYKPNEKFPVDGNQTLICENSNPIDNLFYYPNKKFQLPIVKAGEKIGGFANEFGFEIVLERLGYEPKIELARTKTNYIEVNTITDPLDTSNPTDADYFLHWHAKEECLNYIDPCAFYGSFCGTKVFYYDPTKTNKRTKCNSPEEIYTHILNQVNFVNKNKIYIDIRNDYGDSLNYYKDYGNFIKHNGNNINYNSRNWPINIIESINGDPYVNVTLPIGNNNNSLIFISSLQNKIFKKVQDRFIENNRDDNNYSPEFKVSFCRTLNNALISGYNLIRYFDTSLSDELGGGIKPNRKNHLDYLFQPFDMKCVLGKKNVDTTIKVYQDEVLIVLRKEFYFIGNVGVSEDLFNVTYFAVPKYYYNAKAKSSWVTKKSSSKNIFELIYESYRNVDFRNNNLLIDGSQNDEHIISAKHSYIEFGRNNLDSDDTIFDIVFLGFDKQDFSNYKQQVSTQSNLPIYLIVDEQEILTDNNQIKYKETTIGGTYLTGVTLIEKRVLSTIKIYEDAN